MREFQWEPGEDEADESDHHGKMQHDIKNAEPSIDVSRFIRSHMLGEEDPLGP
jgi:hypothetical protein